MRVRHQLILSVSDDPAGEEGEFLRSGNLPAISSDGFTASASGRFYAPPDQTTVGLSFGDVEQGAGCYVEGLGTFDVTINGSAHLTIQSIQGGAKGKMFFEGRVSSLAVASTVPGVAVTGAYTVWGNTPEIDP